MEFRVIYFQISQQYKVLHPQQKVMFNSEKYDQNNVKYVYNFFYYICIIKYLGFLIVALHYPWQWNYEKNELILCKWTFNWMNILNDICMQLELNSNS
jgi:hypothetical protein